MNILHSSTPVMGCTFSFLSAAAKQAGRMDEFSIKAGSGRRGRLLVRDTAEYSLDSFLSSAADVLPPTFAILRLGVPLPPARVEGDAGWTQYMAWNGHSCQWVASTHPWQPQLAPEASLAFPGRQPLWTGAFRGD